MRRKSLPTPILFLLCLALTGVGFSGWNISGVNKINTNNLNINPGLVEQKDKIFSHINVTTFKLSQDGIVKDDQIVDKGEIVISFEINNLIASNYGYIKDGNFEFVSTIECSDLTFLGYFLKPVVKLGNNIIEETKISDNEIKEDKYLSNSVEVSLMSSGISQVEFIYTINNNLISYFDNLPTLLFSVSTK